MALASLRLHRRCPFLIPRFDYRNFNGRAGQCDIEVILSRTKPRFVVIATELRDNPGMSITNCAELVASHVCRFLDANPLRFVWIEHYGYPAPSPPLRFRTFDRVIFRVDPHVDPYFSRPQWQTMSDADWREFGLEPRQPVI